MKKYKWLKEGEFAEVKALLQIKGMTVPLACKISKRSYGTVFQISKNDTYADFRKSRNDHYKKYLKKGYEPMKAAINTVPSPIAKMTDMEKMRHDIALMKEMLTDLWKARQEKGWLEKLM